MGDDQGAVGGDGAVVAGYGFVFASEFLERGGRVRTPARTS